MSKNNLTILKYGFPNTYKPLSFGHLRSFIVGDLLTRVLKAGNYPVITDLHSNDLGDQLGFLLYYASHHPEKKLSSMEDIYNAFFVMKKKIQEEPHLKEEIFKHLVLCQNDPDYRRVERAAFYELFLNHIQNFMQEFDCSVDLFGKESDYLEPLKELIDQLLPLSLASYVDGALVMKPSPNLTYLPLMMRHQDGRYLYSGIDLAAALHRSDSLKPHKIIYVMTGKQSTQMTQLFDAASQLALNCSLIHVKQGDIIPEGENTPTKAQSLLKKLSLLPCEDITFPNSENRKRFLYAAFKLQNLWRNPKNKLAINLDFFHKNEGYVFLKNVGFYQKKYAHLLEENFSSPEIDALIQEIEATSDLFLIIRILKKHIDHMNRIHHIGYSLNNICTVLSILGLDNWEIVEANFEQPIASDFQEE